jgi:hypothetical protein
MTPQLRLPQASTPTRRAESPRRPTLTALALALLTGLMTMVFTTQAHAGPYVVEQGSNAVGAPVGAPGWSGLTSAGPGAFALQMPAGAGQGYSASASLAFPAGVSVTNAIVDYAVDAPVSAAHSQPQINSSWGSWGWPFTGISPFGGYSGTTETGERSVANPGGLSFNVNCVNFDNISGGCAGATFRVSRLVLTAVDGSAPTIISAPPSDRLLGTPNSTGWLTSTTGTVAVRASDTVTGVYKIMLREGATAVGELLVDSAGRSSCADIDPALGGPQFNSLAPCDSVATDYKLPVNLAPLGDGVHTLDLGVSDGSGNVTWAPTSYTVKLNAPGGSRADPGTPCINGTNDDSGTCIKRAPSATADPSISGTERSGQTLAVDNGTWADVDGATWTYQWQRCTTSASDCEDLAGETNRTLALHDEVAGYAVRVEVTASTEGGSTTAISAVSGQITLDDGELPSRGGSGGSGDVGDVPTTFHDAPSSDGGDGTVTVVKVVKAAPASGDLPVPDQRPSSSRSVNGTGASLPADLTVEIGGQARSNYGVARVIHGRLRNKDGNPIIDAQIDVLVHEDRAGAAGQVAGSVKTDGNGEFRYVLPAGTSRIVTFGYRLRLSDAEYQRTQSVKVTVAPPVALRASARSVRNGRAVTFSGKLTGVPKGSGKQVALQVKKGKRWITFANMRLLHDGTYRSQYRFLRTRHTATYQFRALVAKEPAWPFATTQSRALKVKVAVKDARPTRAKTKRAAPNDVFEHGRIR